MQEYLAAGVLVITSYSIHYTKLYEYSGWGIRRVRNGWLYKVAGRNALEVTLTSGERHLIGSDEPNRLGRAILRTRGHWTSGRVARTLREL